MQMRSQRLPQVLIMTLLGLTGCAHAPDVHAPSAEEQARIDSRFGSELVPEFEQQLKIKDDADVSVYLRNIAESLVRSNGVLKMTPVGVRVIADRGGRWKNYSLPGNRIYLSRSLLKEFQYETQIAAALAIELSHLVKRHFISRISALNLGETPMTGLVSFSPPWVEGGARQSRVDFFGPSGVFAFNREEILEAVRGAVSILYDAGFDPRGLLSLWQIYGNLKDQSPIEGAALESIIEETRKTLANYPPLRNPVVRSEAFLRIQEKIRSL